MFFFFRMCERHKHSDRLAVSVPPQLPAPLFTHGTSSFPPPSGRSNTTFLCIKTPNNQRQHQNTQTHKRIDGGPGQFSFHFLGARTYSLVMKLMNSETHSWTVSLASLAIFAFPGSAFFMIREMLAMGKKRSCSRTFTPSSSSSSSPMAPTFALSTISISLLRHTPEKKTLQSLLVLHTRAYRQGLSCLRDFPLRLFPPPPQPSAPLPCRPAHSWPPRPSADAFAFVFLFFIYICLLHEQWHRAAHVSAPRQAPPPPPPPPPPLMRLAGCTQCPLLTHTLTHTHTHTHTHTSRAELS